MRPEAFGSFLLAALGVCLPLARAGTPAPPPAPPPTAPAPPPAPPQPPPPAPAPPSPAPATSDAPGPAAAPADGGELPPPGASDAEDPWPTDGPPPPDEGKTGGTPEDDGYSASPDYGDPWNRQRSPAAPAGSVAAGDAQQPSARAAETVVLGPPPVPPAMPRLFPPRSLEADELPLVGLHGGRLFLRDRDDWVRLYPGARLELDFRGTFGAGVSDVPAATSDGVLHPQLTIRRLRLELSGELFSRLFFTAGLELGGTPIGETNRARVGARFAPSSALDGPVRPAVVSLSYRVEPWLGVTVGQFHVPFSMDNRTDEARTTMLERPLAIRGFAVPYEKDLGIAAWGDVGERVFSYELGVFTGDGANRLVPDTWPDFVARLTSRPLATTGDCTFAKLAQIGGSVRYGARDLEHVGYDYPAIATGHGFVLWQPAYRDSYGRLVHVVPSGEGWAAGGEIRLPFGLPGGRALDLRGEVYYVHNFTREAVAGFELESTERFGRMQGVGWYALLSAWPFGDSFVTGEPGVMRPTTVDLSEPAPIERGLELYAVASGIAANYTGASREDSLPDPYTPSANIAVYQFGGGAQYWYGTMLRVGLQYLVYFTPDSGDQRRNQAIVVDNFALDPLGNGGGEHLQHELTGRAAVTF